MSGPVALLDEIFESLAKDFARDTLAGRRPASTYRIQLSPSFGFADAAAIVPYLRALGADAVYLSPILAAVPGSTHGYDVTDHGRLNPELGGEEGYGVLVRTLADAGMGQIVDFVPNHMGVGPWNGWWMDVLENGPSSAYASFFDIDWHPRKDELENKVLVPVLGDQYGAALERGELVLVREGGAFYLRYYTHRFPIAPRTVPAALRTGLDGLVGELGADDVELQELQSICTALDKLVPSNAAPSETMVEERAREKEVAKRRLASLCERSPRIRTHVDQAVALFNGHPGDPHSYDLLHDLLEEQAYRLAYWRVAGEEVNYRRFFDVNGLAAIRIEDPRVFTETHRVILDLLSWGRATGLRIDHPDGLYDPAGYFRHLQAAFAAARLRIAAMAKGQPLSEGVMPELIERIAEQMEAGQLPSRPLFIVAEKILARGERMQDGWAVDGTTGYDFLNAVNGLFVDPAGEKPFERLYSRWRGQRANFREEAHTAKKLIAGSLMASELHMLAHGLNRVSETNRRTRDFTLAELTLALVEFVAEFPVYRTYITPRGRIDARDIAYVEAALARARHRLPILDQSIFDFLRDVLLLRWPEHFTPAEQRAWLEFTLKVQQVTGPITAKAVEDTAFYDYLRLASLNEVGGDPEQFGTTPESFHAQNASRLTRWSSSLLATTTHDTKRGEDCRLRIDALSEIPKKWGERLRHWTRLNRRFATGAGSARAPSRNDEILFYQTLVGTLPEEAGQQVPDWDGYTSRLWAYMQKAMREAKRNTSWVHICEPYEQAVRNFVEAALRSPAFLKDIGSFIQGIAAAARISSLSQVALKCASPGVADVYQGCELWDLSLVDPDNRRPVDFAFRERLLAELDRRAAMGPSARAKLAREISSPGALADGRAKLLLLAAGLRLRRADPELFLEGEYLPLEAEGRDAGHVVALARRLAGRAVVCIVPRLILRFSGRGRSAAWQGSVRLSQGLPRSYLDAVTGQEIEGKSLDLSRCFADFPVALLASGPTRSPLRQFLKRWAGV